METLTKQLEQAVDAVVDAEQEMYRVTRAAPPPSPTEQESVERKLRYREDMLVAAARLWREERRMLAGAEARAAGAGIGE